MLSPGAYLQAYESEEGISNVGVENLRVIIKSPICDLLEPDVDHVYQLVATKNVLDAWIRDISAQDTIQSVDIGSGSKQVTVSNRNITHTVNQKRGPMFEDFWIAGATQVLVDHVKDTGCNTVYYETAAKKMSISGRPAKFVG